MRLLISVAMYLLSLTLILIGIAERTVWAPADTKVMTLTVDSVRPFIVVPSKILQLHEGTPVIKVSGPGHVFVATGRESDVHAWIGGTSKNNLVYDKKSKTLDSVVVDGFKPSANPTGSDLWRTERSATSEVSTKVDVSAEAAVLVANDGTRPAPNELSIEWQRNYDLTPSNILLYLGETLLAITAIYNFFLYRSIRNSRRPRRKLPKAPHGPRSKPRRRESALPRRGRRVAGRNYAWLPATVVMIGLVTGCAPASSSNTPTPTATTDTVSKPASLQLGQIRRIVTNVARVAKSADATNSAAQLIPRFSGPALEMRQAAYSLLRKSKKAAALEPIFSSPLTLSLPSATDTWPRTLMVVSGTAEKRLPSMLVLRQMSPREQYRVWYTTTLISGVELPEVPGVEAGSVPVTSDSAYLSVAPTELPTVYGSVIDKGSASPYARDFDLVGDSFYNQVSKIQKDQLKSIKKATLRYKHILADVTPLGLATADGGALVAVYMKDITRIKPTKSNSGIAVNSIEQIALGAKGSVTGVESTYGDMLLFYVPSIGQETKIKLIGWQAGLLKVKAL